MADQTNLRGDLSSREANEEVLEGEELVTRIMEPQGAIEHRTLVTCVGLRVTESKAGLDLIVAEGHTTEEHDSLSGDTRHCIEHPILDAVLAEGEAAKEDNAGPEENRLG